MAAAASPLPDHGFGPGREPIFNIFTGLRGKMARIIQAKCAGLPNIRELVLLSIRLEPALNGSAGGQIS